ncbi:hypothetical protein GGI03_000353 [Coemansia sp. RSA 2337]|nr:hypothetical protein H4S03_000442 [Coemansia sp. S3946]KAJ2469477.1 hypothetical protein GGI03_000353 [Coemansia sp. RSA 2337]
MVCAICLDNLFSTLAMNNPSTTSALGDDNRIAALSCGHTFHLECTTLWRANSLNMNCPMCNVLHIGPFLTLHIECDLKHVTDQDEDTLGLEGLSISDPLRVAESQCNLPLDQADQQATKHRELEAKAAAIKVKLDEKSKRLRRKQAIESALTKKVILVENRVK